MPASEEEGCLLFSSIMRKTSAITSERWTVKVPGCAPPAGPMILALYLETMNIEGTRKDMRKKVTETLPLESVYSSNGARTRVTFMWKITLCDWWAEGKQEVSGQLSMDQGVNTKRFKAPHTYNSALVRINDEERSSEESTYSYIEIKSKLTEVRIISQEELWSSGAASRPAAGHSDPKSWLGHFLSAGFSQIV